MNLAIIPARGGSKGLPKKNIKEINGKPLIAWSIESAKKSKLIDKCIVSTDSEEIAEVARKWGGEVSMRPSELATDESTTIALVKYYSNIYKEASNFIVLQPTSPLREENLIDSCIEMYRSGNYTNLATGFWCKYKEFGSHNNLRRQDYKGFFYDDGNVYILSRNLVEQELWFGSNICKYEIDKFQNFEIDDEVDFVILETLLRKYGSN